MEALNVGKVCIFYFIFYVGNNLPRSSAMLCMVQFIRDIHVAYLAWLANSLFRELLIVSCVVVIKILNAWHLNHHVWYCGCHARV